MIRVCSRFDSVLFTPKISENPSYGNYSRSPYGKTSYCNANPELGRANCIIRFSAPFHRLSSSTAQFRPQPTKTVICNRVIATFGPCRTLFERFKPIGHRQITSRLTQAIRDCIVVPSPLIKPSHLSVCGTLSKNSPNEGNERSS